MELIEKSAVVAEIESKRKYAQHLGDNAINGSMQQFYDGMKQGCVDILSSINTIEVKENLTWEDIRELYIIFAEVDTEIELCKTDIKTETLGYYQEVLKRFKAKRK